MVPRNDLDIKGGTGGGARVARGKGCYVATLHCGNERRDRMTQDEEGDDDATSLFPLEFPCSEERSASQAAVDVGAVA